ncbi:MAG: hypothetical protein AAFX94_08095, partial [Myxococcota bacterium]
TYRAIESCLDDFQEFGEPFCAKGRIAYRLKRAWSDGTTEVVYEPHELIAKLIPLMRRTYANCGHRH